MPTKIMTRLLAGTALSALLTGAAFGAEARPYDIAAQDAATALQMYAIQSGRQVLFPYEAAKGKKAPAIRGDYSDDKVLALLAESAGMRVTSDDGRTVTLVPAPQSGSAAGGGAEVEALIVTAQKREEDIQDVPIAISAFSQEDLTTRQVAGGADLMTQVPNMTFTKTNFSGYSIQIRGIGTQAISATTDAAVAVAMNNTPFIRNRFFEQEFYDLERVEVLRGPQGTLYGRNATAGVVNIVTAKPSFTYEARTSGDIANYNSIRLEGMVNVPLVEDVVALRLAGAWTKRDGFVTNEIDGKPIDGRDLWSTRLSLRFEPTDALSVNLIWEHFEEDDDRLRSGKQLCHKHTPTDVAGIPIPQDSGFAGSAASTFSQGCIPASLYSPDSFETPNGFALPYYAPLGQIGAPVFNMDPYVSETQSRDLRVIESTRKAEYRAMNDTVELQARLDLTQHLILDSETAYAADFVFGTQDFNRFNTKPGAFDASFISRPDVLDENGVFCDPQVGCSDRLVLVDLSTARSRHFSQELRVSSDYDGPFNFSLGANFLRYDTEDKYYVFANSLTLWAANASWTGGDGIYDVTDDPYVGGQADNVDCLRRRYPGNPNEIHGLHGCIYIDPNPLDSLNDQGHNYFLSKNPYRLISYAVFGETYYNVTPDLKITAGLRWTVDKKRAPRIPSWLLAADTYGYPVAEVVEQEWREPTGRVTADWKPNLSFTDDTLLYASYARGYKAGGMNPPPAVIATYGQFGDGGEGNDAVVDSLVQPKIFDAEYVNAYELGAKNTLFNGHVVLNASAFYYDYTGYQISQIINRSAVNSNFDAEVWGLELEADWRPVENLRLGLKLGYEDTRMADGSKAIDLMDRAAGNPDYVVMRPYPTIPSNCIVPVWFATFGGQLRGGYNGFSSGACVDAYAVGVDPITQLPYVPNPTVTAGQLIPDGYPGFDPSAVPNNGEGIFKDLSGNELPNAPHYTATLTGDYTVPLAGGWLMTLHTDLYYQSEAWTRIFNTEGYDKLKAYTNVNLAAIFTNEDAGWKVMAYVKNVLDRDSITGAFLNSDDTGLTTNVFLTEPRLYGLRVTKNFTGGPWWTGANPDHTGPFPLTVEIGGAVDRFDADDERLEPEFVQAFDTLAFPIGVQDEPLDWGDSREAKLVLRPDGGPWSASAWVRFGRTNVAASGTSDDGRIYGCPVYQYICDKYGLDVGNYSFDGNFAGSKANQREEYEVVDFVVGRDFGIGKATRLTASAGVRYAQLKSEASAELWGMPDFQLPYDNWAKYVAEFNRHSSELTTRRDFEGVGPVLSIDGAWTLWSSGGRGRLMVETGASSSVLQGKRNSLVEWETTSHHFQGPIADYRTEQEPVATVVDTGQRSAGEWVTVPTLGASLGLAYDVGRIKIGAGYRWERYFDAIDAGIEERKTYDRTIDGPYFKIAVGFGG